MASIYKRERTQWIKFSLPGKPKPERESLGAIARARAQLIKRRFELELALRTPEIARVELPANLEAHLAKLGWQNSAEEQSPLALDVVRGYLAFIKVENEEHHCRNKTTHLVRFFGTDMLPPDVDEEGAPKKKTKRDRKPMPGVFKGRLLSEVSADCV